MSELISRQAAIDVVCKAGCDCGFCGVECDEVMALETLPTAEPEIIRCKDCLMHGVCRFEQGLGLDGYCSQAERRTDE